MQAPGYGAPIQAPQARDFCGASLDGLCLAWQHHLVCCGFAPHIPSSPSESSPIHRAGGAEAETRCLAEMEHGR